MWQLTYDIIDLKCHLTLRKLGLTKIKTLAPPMRKTMKMLMSKLESWSMIIQKSFACQNGNYKLTCQCENTILSVFTLLQSNNVNNNTLLIQNLHLIQILKTRGKSLSLGKGPCPTAGYGPAWKTKLVLCNIMYYSIKYDNFERYFIMILMFWVFAILHIEHKYYN